MQPQLFINRQLKTVVSYDGIENKNRMKLKFGNETLMFSIKQDNGKSGRKAGHNSDCVKMLSILGESFLQDTPKYEEMKKGIETLRSMDMNTRSMAVRKIITSK